jgi:hypothetical protein
MLVGSAPSSIQQLIAVASVYREMSRYVWRYCHVVFRIPHQLPPRASRNQRVCYGLLFRAVSEALEEIAADLPNLGAKIGILGGRHTWSQNLLDNPHLHCLGPGGGLSPGIGRNAETCRAKS